MNDTNRLLELALKGLEVERVRINQEITDIQSQIHRIGSRLGTRGRTLVANVSGKGNAKTATSRKRRRMSAAARMKLSDAAKRRWVASKKAGKSTL